MNIALIAAYASNRAIGLNNQMPWHLSADLKKFKQTTLGYPLVMGRKTFTAIGKPLPGRANLIVSRNPAFQATGCEVFASLPEALARACAISPLVFVIGGATLYEAALPLADDLYLTEIHRDFPGDTFFPEWPGEDWQEVSREAVADDASVDFAYSFVHWRRVRAVSY